jgi:uncharacterized membrane protein YdbT with pleckstrin-like domain
MAETSLGDEQIVFARRPHPIIFSRAALVALVAALINYRLSIPVVGRLLDLVVFLLFARLFFQGASWARTQYVLTTRRIGVRDGLVSRRERDVLVQKVTDVRIKQGLVEQMLGCGTLIVESAGGRDKLVLRGMPYLQQARDQLVTVVKNAELNRGDGWPPDTRPGA